jgi:GT2 family glycosyltransferase
VISCILPTHNRPDRIARSLTALGALPALGPSSAPAAEVIVVDNASDPPCRVPPRLPNGLAVRAIRLPSNEAAASRNIAARRASSPWLVMLDDDSYPTDAGFLDVLADAPADVAAVGADITLPEGRRESGGLPEVFVGCGVAIRRRPFLDAGGYDPAFHYYAEEYDLCARLLQQGWRVVHDRRFRVRHEKTDAGRDMNVILQRLVRNNGWIIQRYAPDPPPDRRAELLQETIVRYGRIAELESADAGYLEGLGELFATIDQQPRRPLAPELFDRFTGLAHVRESLARWAPIAAGARVAVVDEGKNAWAVHRALSELQIEVVSEPRADVLVIGTLSPGPMMDAWERRCGSARQVLAPWTPAGECATTKQAS